MANQNVYPGGSASDWQNFSQVYPQYQQLMWNNNASANAAMNKIGGMGASSGTPYSSALGQLAMQGASGLQSLFSRGGGGSYGSPSQPTQQIGSNDPNSMWYGDPQGYTNYMTQQKNNTMSSGGLTGAKTAAEMGLLPKQTGAIGSGYDLTTGQNEQSLQGLAGSGALQAAQNQWALAQGGLGNRSAMAGMNQQYYGGTGPLANYGQGATTSSGYLGYGAQPNYNFPHYPGPGQIGTH